MGLFACRLAGLSPRVLQDSAWARRAAILGEAAAAGSMKPDTLRRYLHRLDVRALIAAEKKAFLAWATSANAQALMGVRDTSVNDAARVRAVLALEELETPRDGRGVNVTSIPPSVSVRSSPVT